MGCKYCAKYGRNGLAHGPPNNILHSKCNFNKKWEGWRTEWVCKKSSSTSRNTKISPGVGLDIATIQREIREHG